MNVNSIETGNAPFKLPTFTHTVSAKQPVKDYSKVADAANGQETQLKALDTKTAAPAVVASEKPSRSMSHMVESYDASGRAVTKFVDSGNNVIYQTPSEMVLKTQELMTKPESSTNVTG